MIFSLDLSSLAALNVMATKMLRKQPHAVPWRKGGCLIQDTTTSSLQTVFTLSWFSATWSLALTRMSLRWKFSFVIICSQIDEVISASPLGTILAWVPRPSSSLELSPLPDGWLPCNGTTIPQGLWAGGTTPSINTEGAFLRGGGEDRVLEMEEDQVQEHSHEDPGHNHGCSATSTADPHSHKYRDLYDWCGHDAQGSGAGSGSCGYFYEYPTTTPTTVKVHTSCTTTTKTSSIGGVSSPAKSGGETRPKNMKVMYIMRCWWFLRISVIKLRATTKI